MVDEEPVGLPPAPPSSSELFPTNSSANFLDMINQDVMFGSLRSAAGDVFTEATHMSPSTALSAAPFTSAGDVFLPTIPVTTVANTFVKSYNDYVPPPAAAQTSKNVMPLNPRSVDPKPGTSKSAYPLNFNPRILNETPSVSNPYQGTRIERERDRSPSRTSSDSRKKSKRKSHGSHKSSSRSKSKNKSSHRDSKIKNIFLMKSPPDEHQPASTRSNAVSSAVTHTVTRAINSVTERSVAVTTATVTHTVTTVPQIVGLRTSTISKNATAASCKMSSVIQAAGALAAAKSTTSTLTSHTVTKARAPRSIISPIKSTYLPRTVLYPTPTIITRTTPAATPAADRVCEKFTILSTQTEFPVPASGTDPSKSETDAAPRTRTRLVIPASLNPFAASTAAVDTTAASTVNIHRALHAIRPGQSVLSVPSHAASTTTNTSNTMARTLTRSSFSFPPGATLYAARKLIKSRSNAAVTTEPHTFAIVDGKGAYTTLTISPDFTTTTTGSPLVMAQMQHTTVVTAGVSNTSQVASDSVGRPRSQLLIPIANSQMNTSTSLGYLVSSPIDSDLITSRSSSVAPSTQSAATTTAISSHTLTTISSEALNRIRNRLIFNVPSTAAAGPSLSPATMTPGSNKPRGSVTIIANQLISAATTRELRASVAPSAAVAPRAMFPAPSQAYLTTAPNTSTVSSPSPAEPSTRSLNRIVIPINVHTTSTSHSSESSQGAYIIAGVGSTPSTVRDAVTRSSRVVIPIIHNTSAGTAPACTPAATAAVRPCPAATSGTAGFSTETLSKLRKRLTIQIGTTESSSPYTITRTRAPQTSFTIPAGSISYRPPSTKTSEGSKSPAAMTLVSFAPPSTGGAPATGALLGSPLATRETPSPAITSVTSATPTLTSTGNRFVIKLASSPSATSGGTTSSVTASITTPITSAILSPTLHKFAEPHPVAARPRTFPAARTFPGPRTYSIAHKNTALRPVPRNFNPRIQKAVPSPAPLQIFADVVCPPTTALTETTTTRTNSKSRFTLSHSPGSSTSVSQHKNTGFKSLSTIAHPSSGRTSCSRFLEPRASSEKLILNRSAALVPTRRPGPLAGSRSTRDSRSQHADTTPDSRSQHSDSTRDSRLRHADSTRDSRSQQAETTRDSRSHHVDSTRVSRSQHANAKRDSRSQHADSTRPVTRASPAASDAPQPSTSRYSSNHDHD